MPRSGYERDSGVFVRNVEKRLTLSPCELTVFRLRVAGLDEYQVAERLCVSLRTVQDHASNANHKLGARNLTEAIREAVARGVIGCPFCK